MDLLDRPNNHKSGWLEHGLGFFSRRLKIVRRLFTIFLIQLKNEQVKWPRMVKNNIDGNQIRSIFGEDSDEAAIEWDEYLWAISSVKTRYAQVAKSHKIPK